MGVCVLQMPKGCNRVQARRKQGKSKKMRVFLALNGATSRRSDAKSGRSREESSQSRDVQIQRRDVPESG